jgi:hypothetical protein
MTSFIIFCLVLALITIGSLVLIFTKLKSTAAQVVLTIVTLSFAVIAFIIGLTVLGFSALGRIVGEEIQNQKSQEANRIPKNTEGQEKSVFTQTEIVTGNDYEAQIVKTYKFVDGNESQFYTKQEYCAADLRIKNLASDKVQLGTTDIQYMKKDGTVLYTDSTFFDTVNEKYTYKQFELESQMEITVPITIKCSSQPDYLVIKDYKINFDSTIRDIKFEISF